MAELLWLDGYFNQGTFDRAELEATRRIVYDALKVQRVAEDSAELVFARDTLGLLISDLLEADRTAPQTRQACKQAFSLSRAALARDANSGRAELLKTVCLGWIADEAPLAQKLLLDVELPQEPGIGDSWGERVWQGFMDAWLLLFRKNGWADIEALGIVLARLRRDQATFERGYLGSHVSAHPAAWELVALYHLARAVEILSEYLTQGVADNRFDVRQQVESHFDRASAAIENAGSVVLFEISSILFYAAEQMIDNSLWTMARAVSPEVGDFVSSLVNRERPIFEALAPQRQALADEGLARAAQRSVVVSLPTSAGKTLIAEFRIIQTLSIFKATHAWVAYVAPTRALVNQITTRLRRDLEPLDIIVEKVSPALEVDGFEAELLEEADSERQFGVLVTTPEKLDLMIRGGWQERIGRPLSLVIVDEAHNLSSPKRGIKLELLLATINRELRDSQFLLLTPFINNSEEVARWLDPSSNQAVSLQLDWQPNDRVIALGRRVAGTRRGDCSLELETLATSRATLNVPEIIPLGENRPMGLTYSEAAAPNKWAAAIGGILTQRGATITLAGTPRYTWGIAADLARNRTIKTNVTQDLVSIRTVLARELGASFPLLELMSRGVGVHHSGLPDEAKVLMEWMLENGHLDHLVATTTVAQGVNFPVANVVFASHQYPYGETMPAEDFWNIAGRAGRVDQGQVGVVALAASTDDKASQLTTFVANNIEALNSTLIEMVRLAMTEPSGLKLASLSYRQEWSAFVQFLAHSYRQLGNHDEFVNEIEQVLRGTFGFQSLRTSNPTWALQLIQSVRDYAQGLAGKPLSLVDSTGFSWESVSATLGRLAESRIVPETWEEPIYGDDRRSLRRLIGVMLEVPELRDNLIDGAGGAKEPGSFLANVVHDWVNGMSLPDLASSHFSSDGRDALNSISRCCQRLFGDIAPTIAWGLSAMQSLSMRGQFESLEPDAQRRLRDLPAFAYYGVNTESAVALRLLGVPRTAAVPLARVLGSDDSSAIPENGTVRSRLREGREGDWVRAMGGVGLDYFRVWRILEGSP